MLVAPKIAPSTVKLSSNSMGPLNSVSLELLISTEKSQIRLSSCTHARRSS